MLKNNIIRMFTITHVQHLPCFIYDFMQSRHYYEEINIVYFFIIMT